MEKLYEEYLELVDFVRTYTGDTTDEDYQIKVRKLASLRLLLHTRYGVGRYEGKWGSVHISKL